METKEYINKKNRIKSALMTYTSVNQLRLVSIPSKESYRIYDRDYCILEVCLGKKSNASELSILLIAPVFNDFSFANFAILRQLLGDLNIREYLSKDRLTYSNETLKLVGSLNIDIKKTLKRNFMYSAITNFLTKVIYGVDVFTNKINQINQVSLN